MQGLRKQEDKKFERFFEIVQKTAKTRGCIFFADCGEGRDFATETMEGEDLSGWLIPMQMVEPFEKQFTEGKIDESWMEFIVFAIWRRSPTGIAIDFRTYD